jgi:hypothetical protein
MSRGRAERREKFQVQVCKADAHVTDWMWLKGKNRRTVEGRGGETEAGVWRMIRKHGMQEIMRKKVRTIEGLWDFHCRQVRRMTNSSKP